MNTLQNIKRIISNLRIVEYFSVLFVALTLFIPIFFSEIYATVPNSNDFGPHTQWASDFLEAPQNIPSEVLTHPGWQWAVIISHEIFGHSWQDNAFIVTLSSVLLTVGILFWMLRKILHPLIAGVLAIGLVVIAPIALLYPLDHQLYLGYIGINTYHNPTTLLLKPFAILQFYFASEAFNKRDSNWKSILITFLVSAVAAFAKPSYIICLLPAVGIIALVRIWKKQLIDWKRLLIGILIPSIAILVWQFFLTYTSTEVARIILAPFSVMLGYAKPPFAQISQLIKQRIYSVIYIPFKFILSIIFPAVVTAVFWKESVKDIRMQLGWIGFGFGAVFTYLFAESYYFSAGNFLWSGQITLLILFISCVLFLSEKVLLNMSRISKWLILTSGSLHVIFGIAYYLVILLTSRYY